MTTFRFRLEGDDCSVCGFGDANAVTMRRTAADDDASVTLCPWCLSQAVSTLAMGNSCWSTPEKRDAGRTVEHPDDIERREIEAALKVPR